MTRGKPRGIAWHHARAVRCLRGHPFDELNTFRWVDRDGGQHRQCRACNRIRARRRYWERRNRETR